MGNKVTYQTIASYAYDDIFDIIDTRSYIGDPRDSTNIQKRKFVYTSDPFNTSLSFNLLPYIIVNPDTIDYSSVSANGKYKNVIWNMRVVVRAERDGASNSRTGIGYKDVLQIEDDLMETFNSETVKDILRGYGIYYLQLIKTNQDYPVIDGKECIEAEYVIECKCRMAVST
jgi:hypothetical protein